ncbi:MAG: hypothetical protein GXX93_04875 [Anaerolineae bacterium]|nr:hypothetical protein [Anaerolineae bacterium]
MRRRVARLMLVALGLLVALVLAAAVTFRLQDQTNGTLVSSGRERSYLLYVPDSYDPSTPTPLVITIHGFAQWPAHQMRLSGWNDLADRYGFIVVYPSGTGFPRRWAAGSGSSGGDDPLSEVIFISELITKLEGEYNIDPTRIYANGLSNGGGMSFLLSCALSQRIAAVGLVSGAYLYPWEQCSRDPVPAVVFHGTDDPIVPYGGGPSRSFNVPFPNIPEWVDTLAQRNGCDPGYDQLAQTGEVTRIRYTGCEADVVFYTVAGGGHSWPGGEPLPAFLTGYTTQDIDATQVIWDFFEGHPLPAK